MGIFKELFFTIRDVNKIMPYQKKLQAEIEKLQAEGTCPEGIAEGVSVLGSFKQEDMEDTVACCKQMDEYIALLEQHLDVFSPEIAEKLPKIKEYVADLTLRSKNIAEISEKLEADKKAKEENQNPTE